MPLDPSVANSIASTIDNTSNALSAASASRQGRKWATTQYNKQRQDALSDYAAQNAYNSPAQQMVRLKAAGLNPNLVYGSGTVTGNTSQPIRQSSVPSVDFKAPHVDPGFAVKGVADYQQTQINQATLNNLVTMNAVLTKEVGLKGAQTSNVESGTDINKFNLGFMADTRQLNFDKLFAETSRIQAEGRNLADDWQLKEGLMENRIAAGAQALINARLQAAKSQSEIDYINQHKQNLIKAGVLQDFAIKLSKSGLTTGDPAFLRMLDGLFDDWGL